MQKEKLTMLELFSGIGAQKRGIEQTGLFDVEVLGTSDIDKDAIVAYACIHHNLTQEMIDTFEHYPSLDDMRENLIAANIGFDPAKNKVYNWGSRKESEVKKYWLACVLSKQMGDISKLHSLPYADLLTFSFCCQDISVAGNQKGIIRGETRSGLVYEVLRILENMKQQNRLPKYLLLENVKNLVGKRFIGDFNSLNATIEDIGYNCYWEVLNAKDYGIPQNRERVFGIYIRKDIDNGSYVFPSKVPLKNSLKDFLEEGVDEKYYITDGHLVGAKTTDNTSSLVDTQENIPSSPKCKQVGVLVGGKWDNIHDCCKRVYDEEGLAPTIHTCQGGNTEPKVWHTVKDEVVSLEREPVSHAEWVDEMCRRYVEDSAGVVSGVYTSQSQNFGYSTPLRCLAKCLKTNSDSGVVENRRVRKLTPTECYKLMGFTKEDIDKCYLIGMSNTQLYKQAGNSIVTNCIEGLFEHIYKAQCDEGYFCKDENFWIPSMI